MKRPKIYLAGPTVFLRDAVAVGAAKKALCEKMGYQGLFPFDNEVVDVPGTRTDVAIYRANVAMMRDADAGIFDLTPFRGPGADVGTVFELGLMTGMGKHCVGYTNAEEDLLDRVRLAWDVDRDETTGTWRDAYDMTVEDFGNADNLMVDAALLEGGAPIVRVEAVDRFRDLAGFVCALETLRSRLGGG